MVLSPLKIVGHASIKHRLRQRDRVGSQLLGDVPVRVSELCLPARAVRVNRTVEGRTNGSLVGIIDF